MEEQKYLNTVGWLDMANPQIHTYWEGAWNSGTLEPTRILQDHELVIVNSGACTVKIESNTFKLKPGNFLIIPPGAPHFTIANSPNTHRSCIHFDWAVSKVKNYKTLYVFGTTIPEGFHIKQAPAFVPKGILHGHFSSASQLDKLIKSFGFNWKLGGQHNIGACRGILLQIFYDLFSKENQQIHLRSVSQSLAYDIKRKLDSAPREMMPVKKILQSTPYSYEHMMRVFAGEFGLSPLQYLNSARIQKAQLLIKENKFNVSEVANAVGFNDCAYFVRFFRKHTHMTPGQYARTV